MAQSDEPEIDLTSDQPATLREVDRIAPSNDRLRQIAKKRPPDASWLNGEEERPF